MLRDASDSSPRSSWRLSSKVCSENRLPRLQTGGRDRCRRCGGGQGCSDQAVTRDAMYIITARHPASGGVKETRRAIEIPQAVNILYIFI